MKADFGMEYGKQEPVAQGRRRMAAVVFAILAFFVVLLSASSPALANDGEPGAVEGRAPGQAPVLPAQTGRQPNQLFQGDLRVEPGQTINGDTVVYDGNVWIGREGRINGNLVVFRGNVEVIEGATIAGNLDLFSGDAVVAGSLTGNLTLWNGNALLLDSARVGGNVSVLSGEIEQSPGAVVSGNRVEGPRFGFGGSSRLPSFDFDFGGGNAAVSRASGPLSVLQWVGAFLARLLGAILLTGFVAVLVGLAVHVRPDTVRRVGIRIASGPAVSFVIGLTVNLVLVFLGGLLAITICLLPIALIPMLALLAVNLLGWAALSQMLGERIEAAIERPMEDWVAAGVGAVILTAVFALLWAFGGFFRFVGGSALLLTASFGAGAVLMPYVERAFRRVDRSQSAAETTSTPQEATNVGFYGSDTEGAMRDSTVAPHVATDAERVQEQVGSSNADAVEAPPTDLDKGDLRTDSAVGAASGTVAEAGGEQPASVAAEDDFTTLKGVGPVLDGRLKDAKVRTFSQLAALSAAEVAEITGWSAERVRRSEILEQARTAAG